MGQHSSINNGPEVFPLNAKYGKMAVIGQILLSVLPRYMETPDEKGQSLTALSLCVPLWVMACCLLLHLVLTNGH